MENERSCCNNSPSISKESCMYFILGAASAFAAFLLSFCGCEVFESMVPQAVWYYDKPQYKDYCSKYANNQFADVSHLVISGKEFLKTDLSTISVVHGKIPRILHQQHAKFGVVPKFMQPYVEGCSEKNPNWVHVFWEDDDFEILLDTYYPQYKEPFQNMPYQIQKLDAIRYFMLHKFGGVYLDTDVECLSSLDAWLEEFPYDILMEPIHMMSSAPGDKLWEDLVKELFDVRSKGWISKHYSAGALLISAVLKDYAGERDSILVDSAEFLFRKRFLSMLGIASWHWKRTKECMLNFLFILSLVFFVKGLFLLLACKKATDSMECEKAV